MSLAAELESYFPREAPEYPAPIHCSSEYFQEVYLGASACLTTQLPPGDEILRLKYWFIRQNRNERQAELDLKKNRNTCTFWNFTAFK